MGLSLRMWLSGSPDGAGNLPPSSVMFHRVLKSRCDVVSGDLSRLNLWEKFRIKWGLQFTNSYTGKSFLHRNEETISIFYLHIFRRISNAMRYWGSFPFELWSFRRIKACSDIEPDWGNFSEPTHPPIQTKASKCREQWTQSHQIYDFCAISRASVV